MTKIDNRKDILLLLLYSPGIKKDVNEPISGRTRLVKMVFLFNEELFKYFKKDVKLTEQDLYQFFPWNFGPFSKEVYEDINFFLLRDFIEISQGTGSIPTEEAQELNEWAEDWSQKGIEDDDILFDQKYNEEILKLTAKGEKFAQTLFESLSDSQKDMISQFKNKMQITSLRAILTYVYNKYPEQITRSTIKNNILK